MNETRNDSTAEVRLAELIWRTIKLRFALFFLTIAAILLIWTTIETGHKKALLLEKDFAQQELGTLKKLAAQGNTVLPSVADMERLAADSPGILIETEKRAVSLLLPLLGTDTKAAKARQILAERQQALDDYDQRHRDAFQIEVHFPYLQGSATLNALTLSDAWPFFVIAMVLVIVALGYQQKNYELILSLERTKWRTGRERARSLALAEFFGGILTKHVDRGKEVWLYKRRLALYPESFITGCLYLAVLYLSLRLLAAYNPTLVHRTDSIFFSYYSLAWASLVISGFLVYRTHAYYRRELVEAMGANVTNGYFPFVGSATSGVRQQIRKVRRARFYRYSATTFVLAGLGLVSLSLLWTQPPFILRGYKFLQHQDPSSTAGGIAFFRLDPYLFREMRIQVIFGVLFLIVCLWHGALQISRRPLLSGMSRFVRLIRISMGYALLYLAGNFLLYLGVLQYQSETNVSTSMLDMIFSPRGIASPRGLPLLFYNPTWQFFLFLFACVALALGGKSVSPSGAHESGDS